MCTICGNFYRRHLDDYCYTGNIIYHRVDDYRYPGDIMRSRITCECPRTNTYVDYYY